MSVAESSLGKNSLSHNETMFLERLSSWLNANQIKLPDSLGTSLWYGQDTIPIQQSLPIVVFPESSKQVSQILKAASDNQVSLHPISTGNNWGYGGALRPSEQTSVVLDLRRMASVREVNSELAFAVIEPGVTQKRLADELKPYGLQMDPSGAGPDTSVLGNILERGYGAGHYGDHFLSLCGLEVVLPSGELVRTGFWGQGDLKGHEHIFKWGVGPYVEGLFTQANFGVVTKAAVWLHPEPEAFEACYFSFSTLEDFTTAAVKLRALLLHGVLGSAVNIASKSRIVSTRQQYPWKEAKQVTPLPEDLYSQGQNKVSEWTGCICLSGTKRQVKMQKKELKRALKGLTEKVRFVNQRKLSLYRFFSGGSSKLKVDSVTKAFRLLRGEPAELTLRSPYWRNRMKVPDKNLHPARDNCGLIWFAPVVPMDAARIFQFVEMVRPIVKSYGFDDCFGFLSVNSRAFLCSFPILYDRDNEKDRERALRCYSDLSSACAELKFFSYRRSIHSMPQHHCSVKERQYWQFIRTLKNAIDPKGIISPGRYTD